MTQKIDFRYDNQTLSIGNLAIIPRVGELVSLSGYAAAKGGLDKFTLTRPLTVDMISHFFYEDLHQITIMLKDTITK